MPAPYGIVLYTRAPLQLSGAYAQVECFLVQPGIFDELILPHPAMTDLAFYLQPAIGKEHVHIISEGEADLRDRQCVTAYTQGAAGQVLVHPPAPFFLAARPALQPP